MKNINLKFVTVLFCYLLVFALSIKSFREPDLWWQIRTGEWIIENKEVPKVDVFSYTMKGTEWINIKWGFEVLAAIVSKITGPESVYLIQAIISVLILFFLFRLAKLFSSIHKKEYNLSTFVIVLLITIVSIEYRIIGRPEMFSHLFTVIFLYLLFLFQKENSKKIFLLIPLQMLWANLHEAFAIGIVMIFIFTFSSLFEWFILKKRKTPCSPQKFYLLATVLIASILSVVINPYGVKLLLRPFNIINQVYENKYTTELFSFNNSVYWQKEAFIALFFLLFIVIGMIGFIRGNKKMKLFDKILKIGPGYILVLLAFLYLALTAYRNIIFFILVSFPVFYLVINNFILHFTNRFKVLSKFSKSIAFILIFIFYILVVSNNYYKLTGSRDRFGLEVLSTGNPVDAANWIEKKGLKNKKCFSDYLVSSCLLWKLQPTFKTYIDLRDFDVFPQEFFNKFLTTINNYEEFIRTDSIEKFDYVVLIRSQFKELHSYLYNDSIYACTYVDAVAAVYEKTDSFTREDIFSECNPVPVSAFSNTINHILNPFYKKYNYENFDVDYVAAGYFIGVFQYGHAARRAEKIIAKGSQKDKGFEILGNIYYEQSIRTRDSLKSVILIDQARDNFMEAVRLNKGNIIAQSGLGHIFYAKGNYKASLLKFEKCIEEDSRNYEAHIMAGENCKILLRQNPAKRDELLAKMLNYFLKADDLNPGNPFILFNIGEIYFSMNNCKKAITYLKRIKDDPVLGEINRNAVIKYLRECGE